jgi:hypothetical protein
MPANICTPLFNNGDEPMTVRVTAPVVGKTFGAISADIQSGPAITTTALPATWDGGNIQAATCGAGLKADGVFAYDQVTGGVVPIHRAGNVVPITAGAAITFGQEVQSDAAGKAIPLAAGKSLGVAEASAVLNADCFVRLTL